ncbi:hypothetical protein D3C86_1688640 [compost metagenome]
MGLGRRIAGLEPEGRHADQDVHEPDGQHGQEVPNEVPARERHGRHRGGLGLAFAQEVVGERGADRHLAHDRLEIGEGLQRLAIGLEQAIVGGQALLRTVPGGIVLRGDRQGRLGAKAGEGLADQPDGTEGHGQRGNEPNQAKDFEEEHPGGGAAF